ncbi:MAG: ABC transporter ATP-binding protein, partial [Elusimicrobia bacterium]|nr:ABC transporter ATP-binding protein [Elusimicrobiota bacterium]
EQISKRFSNGRRSILVLDRVHLTVETGETVAIVGPSGSGKSTLLGLLSGLDSPTEGRVFLSGSDLQSFREDQMAEIWNKRMGFVFQSYYLLPTLTAEENVRIPLEIAGDPRGEEKAKFWLEKVGLGERGNHLPNQLSGGEQQRVALARAMISSPEILFADEPTGNLDTQTGKEMAHLLFSLVQEQGTTLVLVTHELSLAKQAKRIVRLEGGKIIKEFSPKELENMDAFFGAS